ncbi:MAG: LamG domain-containing protein, partial [Candidatus Paceibacterota bacterium]
EASGTLYDSSGKGNNGTQSGGVTYGATGKVGNALSFDGVDDYVETNDSNSLDINLSDFSIAFWIKTMTTSNTNSYRIINKRASNYIGYEIYIEAGSNLTAYFISDSGGYSFGDIGSTNIRDANWHCVVLVFNRIHNAMVYIDGNIKSPQRDISTRQGSLNNSQPLRIGSSGSSVANLFNGLIDDVRIYNRALSATEIQALYNATNK